MLKITITLDDSVAPDLVQEAGVFVARLMVRGQGAFAMEGDPMLAYQLAAAGVPGAQRRSHHKQPAASANGYRPTPTAQTPAAHVAAGRLPSGRPHRSAEAIEKQKRTMARRRKEQAKAKP